MPSDSPIRTRAQKEWAPLSLWYRLALWVATIYIVGMALVALTLLYFGTYPVSLRPIEVLIWVGTLIGIALLFVRIEAWPYEK